MLKIDLALTILLLAGCTCRQLMRSPSAAARPAPLVVNMDGNGDLSIGGGSVSVPAEDLPLLVKEVGPDRPVILSGAGDLKKMIAEKQQLQAAGFTNVVIGAVSE